MFPTDAFLLEKDPPAIVYVSEKQTQDDEWGFVQFPSLNRLPNGNLLLTFQVAEDSSSSYGTDSSRYFISLDEGKSWQPIRNDEREKLQAYAGVPVKDDSRIALETPKPPAIDQLSLPEKPYTWIPYDYTYSEPEKAYQFDNLPPALQTLSIRRTNDNGATKTEKAPISLQNDLRIISGDHFPIIFFGPLKPLPNGDILGIFYPSYATNDNRVDTKSGSLIVQSSDGGKSWQQLDRLPYEPDLEYDPKAYLRGGFTEAGAEILKDGSLLLVLRTADGTPEPFPGFVECGPLYSAKRSPDGEWTKPTPISPFGVMPQLLKLKSGLLVLSYGRPGVMVRISQDEGQSWSAPFPILKPERINPRDETCGYTSIIEDPHNPRAFYIAYSNFRYPGKDQKLHKAIQVEHCTIKGPLSLPPPPVNEATETDEVVEQYYSSDNGVLAVRIPLLHNQPNGLTEGFYQTGTPSFITPYKQGTIHGVQKFFAPEGYLIKTIPYIDGKRHGVVRYYDQKGNILREQYVFNDEACSDFEFFEKTNATESK